MSIREDVQNAMKDALRAKDQERLETLRMIKGALLLKEKEGGAVSEADAVQTLRSEIRKRQQTIEILKEHNKQPEIEATEREIAIIDSFLPQQMSREQLTERVKAYLAEHPDMNHAGKLTGAMKKELGDQADGKMLNEVCREVVGG